MARESLCGRLGYEFTRPDLLERALTHRSYSQANNERLEFLGDSVLNCSVAAILYEKYPEMPEGQLSRVRSNLVNQQTLADLALRLELGDSLLLGEGERKSAGARRPSILADAMEALLGAIYLDGGFSAAQRVLLTLYTPLLENPGLHTQVKDAKTLLQEFLQGRKLPLPQYSVTAIKGEAHAQVFLVACSVPALDVITHGEGASRRAAEQAAADAAYRMIHG
jgi:ribonuclease-3